MSGYLHSGGIVGRMIMWKDPIVQEIRKVRETRASRLNFDIKAIIEDARERQKRSKHRVVSFIKGKTKAS